MSYFVPCNTAAPLTENINGQYRFAVNGSLNPAMLVHPYTYISSNVNASSSYTGTLVKEYGRCGDQIQPTPEGQPIKFESAPSLITTCEVVASSYGNASGSAIANVNVTEYDDIVAQGYILLNPCCAGDCVQKSSSAGGGGINAVLPGSLSNGLSVVRTFTSNQPYCTSCVPGQNPKPCNNQSLVTEGGVCRVRSDEEIKSIYCGQDVASGDSGPGSMGVYTICAQADIDGNLPFFGDFKGQPGKSYIEYSFSAGLQDDCIQLASNDIIVKISDNTQVLLIAPGALHIQYSGTGAVAIFDNFTKPTSFFFSVNISAEYTEDNEKPWGDGPYTELECAGIAQGYTKSRSESYTFSYIETLSL